MLHDPSLFFGRSLRRTDRIRSKVSRNRNFVSVYVTNFINEKADDPIRFALGVRFFNRRQSFACFLYLYFVLLELHRAAGNGVQFVLLCLKQNYKVFSKS